MTQLLKKHLLMLVWLIASPTLLFSQGFSPVIDVAWGDHNSVKETVSNKAVTVGAGNPTTYYNEVLKRWVAKFTGSADCFYKINYDEELVNTFTQNFAMEVVYKTNTTTGEIAPFSSQEYGGVGIEQIDGKIMFYINIDGTYVTLTSSTHVIAGEFYHVICNYSKTDGTISLFVNGTLEDKATVSGEVHLPNETTNWIGIGGDMYYQNTEAQYTFDGEIACARIYKGCPSENEVQDLFAATHLQMSEVLKPMIDVCFDNGNKVYDAVSGKKIFVGAKAPQTYYNESFSRWMANFTGESTCFYRINYDKDIVNALTNGFTWEVMYKTDDATKHVTPMSAMQAGGIGFDQDAAKLSFYLHDSDDYQTVTSKTTIESDKYYHAVFTYSKSSNTISLYVNGILEDEKEVNGSVVLPDQEVNWIGFGGDMCGNTEEVEYALQGDLAVARMYKGVATADEVMNLFCLSDIPPVVNEPVQPDLVELAFASDHSVINKVAGGLKIKTSAKQPQLHYDPLYNLKGANFEGNEETFYSIDYSQNESFKSQLRQEFTFESLFKTNGYGEQGIFSSQQYGGLGLEVINKIVYFYLFLDGDYQYITSTTPIVPNELNHVFVTYSKQQKQLKLYINGVLNNTLNVNGELGYSDLSNQWLAIGGDTSDNPKVCQFPLNGQLFKANIYSKVLTPIQIKSLYTKAPRPAKVEPGIYLLKSVQGNQASVSEMLLNGCYNLKTAKLNAVANVNVDLGSMWEIREMPGAKHHYEIKNMLTEKSVYSFSDLSCQDGGKPVSFYQQEDGQYIMSCNGCLFAEGNKLSAIWTNDNANPRWTLEAISTAQMQSFVDRTKQNLASLYAEGYDKYPINSSIDSLLQQPTTLQNCRDIYNASFVAQTKKLRVLQYNTWNNGNMVGGTKSITATIEQTQPDVVLLQEVRGQYFIDELIKYFRAKGVTYYGQSLNISSAILTKYPIESIRNSDELGQDSYAFVKAIINVDNLKFAFYSVHLDWKHLSFYNVRGFDGHSDTRPYEKIEPWTNVDDVLNENRLSRRPDEVRALIADAKKEIADNHIVILGGDFNEPSYLDWQEDTKNLRDHNNLVINWDCSMMFKDAGFVDCYRQIYPDPVTHPGFTCNAGNKWANPNDLNWAYGADDRERIDLNYYYPNSNIRLVNSFVVGPKEDFFDQKVQYEATEDSIFTPNCVWASDHKAVLNEYDLMVKAPIAHNDTQLKEGKYYVHTTNVDESKERFLTVDRIRRLVLKREKTSWLPQCWDYQHHLLSCKIGNEYFLNSDLRLKNTAERLDVFSRSAADLSHVSMAFNLSDDFTGDYIVADSTCYSMKQANPKTVGEDVAFCFTFIPAASGVTSTDTIEKVMFVQNECAPAAKFHADQVKWYAVFTADKYKSVYFPADAVCKIPNDKKNILIDVYTYDKNEKNFAQKSMMLSEVKHIPAGAYIVKMAETCPIEFSLNGVTFEEVDLKQLDFVGTNVAAQQEVSGYKLNEERGVLSYVDRMAVGPFEAFIPCQKTDNMDMEIDVNKTTGIASAAADVEISVEHRQIHVRGTSNYQIVGANGICYGKQVVLDNGVYIVQFPDAKRNTKVIIK